jgi:ubiquinone/menaquinone biosynthesis C-methylase UbiE
MGNNSYKEFSQIYDSLMNDIDYKKWTSFIMKKVGSKNKILEAACGTGSITSVLSDNNYKVTAFDLSQDMLMKAYDKIRKNPGIKLLNQNMINFKIDDKFEAAICGCDGVNYLNKDEILLFFKSVYEHLLPDSQFIFDISTKNKYMTLYNETYVYDDGEIFYVWENMLDLEEKKVNIEINFFVNSSNNKYDRINEIQIQYIHEISDIASSLEEAGFSNIKIYDDYNEELINISSLRAVFTALKK